MKKLLLTTAVFFAFACNTGNLDNEGSETNNESNAEQHSKENISPQGEDRIAVDTVSGANGIGGEKQDELRYGQFFRDTNRAGRRYNGRATTVLPQPLMQRQQFEPNEAPA